MRCPRDSTELQQKIYEGQVEVDQCPACAGMFLDKGELETIQATIEKDPRKDVVSAVESSWAAVEVTGDEAQGPVQCLKCATTMDRRRYGFGSNTLIDECPQGCGLWLDGGEIQQLESLFETSQQEIQIPLTWRIWAAVRGALHKA